MTTSPDDPLPDDAKPASTPRHQSFWFPVAPESGAESSQDEPEPAPARCPAPPTVNGLGWKAPRRVHVPRFERDAAPENTTPGSGPAALEEACISAGSGLELTGVRFEGNALVATLRTTDADSIRTLGDALAPASELGVYAISGSDSELESLAQSHAEAVRTLSAPRVPTAYDGTVRQLREHIVPPNLVDHVEPSGRSGEEIDRLNVASQEARRAHDADARWKERSCRKGSGPSVHRGNVDGLVAAIGEERALMILSGSADRIVDAEFDPDFQEVQRAGEPPEPDNPPKGAEAAQAPADPRGRDDATPNDDVVPQGIQVSIDGGGNDDTFSCALWSNGTFTIYPSDGPRLTLNRRDSRALILYVNETLSDRVRIEG